MARLQRLKRNDRGARQQRRDDLKRGAFRRRADENHISLFNMRQKRVLLRLVEPMDFVNEKDRLSVMKFEPFLGEGDFLAQLGGSFVGGMERLKSGLGAAGR